MIYLMIGLGGGLGAISRHLASSFLSYASLMGLPLGTLVVNIIGCLLIGAFVANQDETSSSVAEYFFVIGFLGSFTTFSAFTKEALIFFNQENFLISFLYISSTIMLCLISTYIGFKFFK
jgi:CrcB protein